MNRPRRRAFTIVEAAMAMVIVSLMVGAALSVSASVSRSHHADSEQATGLSLADALADEIRDRAYYEPGGSLGVMGLDAGETAGDHSTFDDVDDYHGLVETTLTDRFGNKIPGVSGWERRVTVEWVTLRDLTKVSATGTGLKRIIITVKHNGRVVITRYALRSNSH